jgi:hypothetical protein
MKKIIMVLTMALTLSTSFAFTGEESISKKAVNAFKTEFAGATNAAWTAANNCYKVTFNLGDQQLFAYYSTSGEFMAVTRHISSFNLPLNLQSSLKKSWSNYWITDLFEIANQEGTAYYVTLETADSKIVLKSTDGGNWSIQQKVQKA